MHDHKMKRSLVLYFTVVWFILHSLSCNAEETIRLASGEWPPYQSQHLKHAGVVSRIVSEAFASEGIKVEFGYFPWKRSFLLAETGRWDGTFVWFNTAERREQFYISEPVVDIKYVFFHKRNFPFNWQKIEDLKSLRIGATIGYDYGKSFQSAEKEKQTRVIRRPSDTENFMRLSNDLIHIFPCDVEVGYEILRKEYGPKAEELFTHHPLPVKSAPHHLLLTKKDIRNEERMAKFNRGLKALQENGKYNQFFTESRNADYHK